MQYLGTLRADVSLRAHLLSGASMLCLTLLAGDPATADPATNQMPGSHYERFYISLEGAYLFNRSPVNLSFGDVLDAQPALRPGRNGARVGMTVGGFVNPAWDWRAGWQGNWLDDRNTFGIDDNPNDTVVSASNRMSMHRFTGDLGVRLPGNPNVRLFGGLSLLNVNNDLDYGYSDVGKLGNFAHRTELWALGPRLGAEVTVPFDTNSFAKFSGAGAVMFGRRDHEYTFNFTDFPPDSGTRSLDRSVTVYNLEAAASVGYRFHPTSTIEIGYQFQQYWNAVPQISGATTTGEFAQSDGRVLLHGPIAKITVALP
jgi:hypothetical protein